MERLGDGAGDPAAAAVTCNERCIRALDTGKANCASDPTFATYAAVPAACAEDTANAQCDATAQSFLTFVDQSCCRDEDCSGLPKECTEECANTYMPFFSRCGRHVFGDDQTNLAKCVAQGRAKLRYREAGTSRHDNLLAMLDALEEIDWPDLEDDLGSGDEERSSDGARLATAFEAHERLKFSKPVTLAAP